MCGIAGFLLSTARCDRLSLEATLRSMTAAVRHRGPDDSGVWTDGRVGLGHARLSIIDLSTAGHQPMSDKDCRVIVALNGEIYNFKELRRELEAKGQVFSSHSDTEVIVLGYLTWGIEVVKRLRGMFAIALWDTVRRRLFLIRDRVGKKPLFYGRSNGTLLFASEPKSIFAWPGVERRPNLEAIHHYLTLQYVPAPLSAFKGFSKVPPGHYLEVDETGLSELRGYWALPQPMLAKPRPAEALQEEMVHHLEEAVRIRMVSDVPLGAFLSGGVDSSAVVAMMARCGGGRVKTFTIGFDESGYDERSYARMVAERYGTDHHELVVEPHVADLVPKLAWHYGEPFADSSAIPTYYVSEMARRHVAVVLNGDGGDESFLGYGRYKSCLDRQWVDRVPHALRVLASAWAGSFPGWAEHTRLGRSLHWRLQQMGDLYSRRYEPSIAYWSERDKATGYGPVLAPYLVRPTLDILERYFAEAPSMLSGAAWADIHTYLPDDLLVKVDIASMANSLESRSPLLDQEIMAWAATIPAEQKMLGGETKWLLKKVMEPFLPSDVLYRPKMGFGVPIDQWLNGELKEMAMDLLCSSQATARGLFAPGFGERLLREHREGINAHTTRIWAMVMLEQWYRTWIDETPPPVA